jgi:prevent-host-death family protein
MPTGGYFTRERRIEKPEFPARTLEPTSSAPYKAPGTWPLNPGTLFSPHPGEDRQILLVEARSGRQQLVPAGQYVSPPQSHGFHRSTLKAGCLPAFRLEHQLAFPEVNRHAAVVGDVAGQQLARKGGLDVALKETLERARPKDRIVAGAGDVFLGRVGQLQLDVPVGQPRPQQYSHPGWEKSVLVEDSLIAIALMAIVVTMSTATIEQFQSNPASLLAAVENGEPILIARGATPVARLLPVEKPEPLTVERENWLRAAEQSLARAYGPDEPEYGPGKIIETNPHYHP